MEISTQSLVTLGAVVILALVMGFNRSERSITNQKKLASDDFSNKILQKKFEDALEQIEKPHKELLDDRAYISKLIQPHKKSQNQKAIVQYANGALPGLSSLVSSIAAHRKKKFPDEFSYGNTGVFASTDPSEFGFLSEAHGAAVSNDSEFAKKYPDLQKVFAKIKSYAFALPSATHKFGSWVYHDEHNKVVASRPIAGLGGNDETFVKKWDGPALVDTKGNAIQEDKLCPSWGRDVWPIDQYEDVQAYCWTPNCFMVEDNGDKNGGCFVYKMQDDTYRAMVWSLSKSTDKEPPSGDEDADKSIAVRSLTCSLVLFLSFLLAMSDL